jgi:sulfate adenylyltransferase
VTDGPVELLVPPERAIELREASRTWPSWDLTPGQVSDLELLLAGGYSPLRGFMTRAAAESVERSGRLPDGTPWPVAITLEGGAGPAAAAPPGTTVALRDAEGVMLAALHVEDVWESGGTRHRGGRLEGLQFPVHYDFRELRLTPAQLRARFRQAGWTTIVAARGSALLGRAALEEALRRAREAGAGLLLYEPVGFGTLADPDHYTRIRSLQALLGHCPPGSAAAALLPLARASGDLASVVARNYGCDRILEPSVPPLTEEALARFLEEGRPIPPDLTYPEVERELRHRHPPRSRQGFTVFFTGLSGSGKSTIANVLLAKFLERAERYVTLLDGDLVRKHLSSELTFSKEHRDLNIRRIGYVASEITKHGGVAICSPIAPYESIRREVRGMIEAVGGFVLVHVATPLEVCERRDRKGLYAKARAGALKAFTGISDPYEPPPRAEVTIDTTLVRPEEAADRILEHLEAQGYLGGRP